jgi:hypothetical protein
MFKGLVSNPARLKSYEGSREVVSPTSKGLTRSSRLGRPFHEHPEQTAIAKGPGGQKISLADRTVKFLWLPHVPPLAARSSDETRTASFVRRMPLINHSCERKFIEKDQRFCIPTTALSFKGADGEL